MRYDSRHRVVWCSDWKHGGRVMAESRLKERLGLELSSETRFRYPRYALHSRKVSAVSTCDLAAYLTFHFTKSLATGQGL